MEATAKLWSVRITRRGVMAAATALPLAEALTPSVVHADLFGDIGVLLAQLEQQLQLVSHAISTVQNLMATVDRLTKVADSTKMVLKHVGQGGLTGLLNDAQAFLGIARGVASDLRRIDMDAKWWDDRIIGPMLGVKMTPEQQLQARQAFQDMDRDRIQNAAKMHEASQKLVTDSNEATASAIDAANKASTTDGVVGQLEIVSNVGAMNARIARNQAQMTASLVDANTAAEARMAAERETNRKATEDAMKGLGDQPVTAPADLPFDIEHGWQ